MAYDLQEQETIEGLKAWWKEYRNIVILAAAVFVVTVAGMQGWRYYQRIQAEQAAVLYGALQKVVASNDAKKIRDAAAAVVDKFPRTSYAPRAALISAKASYESGDRVGAKAQLLWVTEHGREEELQDVARLRLAGILLDEKNYADALKTLEAKHGESFSGLYADLKGDILMAQGKAAEARSAYQAALDKLDKQSPYRNLLQMKLDALGGS